jgi:branched-chain amino acid aminotransferase
MPQHQAQLTLHDAGFVLGATVTDLCRTFQRRLFRWPDHLARFRHGCRLAAVPLEASDDQLTRRAEELIAHNGALLEPQQELALVVFATPGPIGYYLGEPGGPGDGPPTLGMHTFPLSLGRYARWFREGARLVTPAVRAPTQSVDPRIKQRSRLHWWLAQQEVQALDATASALLLDETGQLTETAAANFLLVRGGVVCSPPGSLVLGGISLAVTEELCRQIGVGFEERPLTLADCRDADEALLTGTSFCLAGVSRINDMTLPWPGPVYRRLQEAWNQLVQIDIVGQIEALGSGHSAR